jgi:hypothetical protein
MPKLKNPRHEHFIVTYHGNGHLAGEAYSVAYPHVTKIESRDAAASRLLRMPAVIRRLAELQDGSAKRAEITVEAQLMKLERIRLKAEREKQYGVAQQCVVSQAKLAGIWVEKSEQQTNDHVQYIISDRPKSSEEWIKRFGGED